MTDHTRHALVFFSAGYNSCVRYLIDGYNLAHKITLSPGKVTPAELQAARSNLLELIADAHREESSKVSVIFDTRRTRRVEPSATFRGIDVRFAVGEQADDMIERLIQTHPHPKQLTVVSDDHRLQTAANKRHCIVLNCEEYLDRLEQKPPIGPAPAALPEKPVIGNIEEWLAAFEDGHSIGPFEG